MELSPLANPANLVDPGKLSLSKPGGSQRGMKKQAREATGESSTLRTGVNMSTDNAGKMLDKGASEKPYRPIASSIMVDCGEKVVVTGLWADL